MKRKKTHRAKTAIHSRKERIPFIEHVYELRRRLFYVALTVVLFSGVGYSIQQTLVAIILKPAANQQFIYTSPGGGINFLFQICIYFGVVLALPLIVYHIFKYMEPLIPRYTRKFIVQSCAFSVVLALIGLSFGYFIGLPAALHFLANQFTTDQVKPLFTIQEFMSFVSIYLVGSAALFQIPLIMLFINRIKPLKPLKLLKSERWVVLAAFVAAAVITPTPDIFNQSIIAGPIIGVYQLGIILVWLHNRNHATSRRALEKRDEAMRAERLAKRKQARLLEATPLPAKPKTPPTILDRVPTPLQSVAAIRKAEATQAAPINRFRPARPVVRARANYQARPAQRWSDFGDVRPSTGFPQSR